MKIATRTVKDVLVLDLEGSLTVGTDVKALHNTIETAKSNKILINLSGLDKMDSSGLGELVAISNEFSRKGISSSFLAIPKQLSLLETTKLNAFDDEIDAINSFR